jgi:hypothetical protein
MSIVCNLASMHIISAQAKSMCICLRDSWQQRHKISRRASFANKDTLPSGYFFHRLVGGKAFVIARRASSNICLQRSTAQSWRMAINTPASIKTKSNLCKKRSITSDRSWEVHHFSKADHTRIIKEWLKVCTLQYCVG